MPVKLFVPEKRACMKNALPWFPPLLKSSPN